MVSHGWCKDRGAHPTQLSYFIRKQLIYLQLNDNKTCILTINCKLQKKKKKNIYKKKYTTLSEQFRNSKHTKSTKLRLHTTVVDWA